MYYFDSIGFNDLNLVLKLYKKQERPLEEVLSFFSLAKNIKKVNKIYPDLEPIQVNEAIKIPNAEQRMVALRVFSPEEFVDKLGAKVLDTQTVNKKHIRWDDNLKPYEFTFEDTYTLYQVSAKKLGLQERSWWKSPDIFFVKCKCASTDKLYYIYVSPEAAEKKDALEAIAWTMQINGTPINKSQYLTLMYSET